MNEIPEEVEQQVKASGWILTPPQFQKRHAEAQFMDQTGEISLLTTERDNLLLQVDTLLEEVELLKVQLADAISQIPIKRPPGRPKKVESES